LLFVGFVDNILRAIIFGQTAPVPMIIVFIGSFGGFITMGLLGLFTGAVLLALGYKILMHWIDPIVAQKEDDKLVIRRKKFLKKET
jgi:predicted PurR-regulated permease PerM